MAIDTTSPRSRRALLGAVLGAGVATVATALGRPVPVRAGVDGDVVLGSTDNVASTTTKITNSTTGAEVIWGASSSFGTGVLGTSQTGQGVTGNSLAGGIGVQGISTTNKGVVGSSTSGTGVYGSTSGTVPGTVGRSYGDGTGVLGFSADGLAVDPTAPAKTGIYGRASQDSNARGVHGQSTSGRGIFGQATSGVGAYGYATSGTGVYGTATTGYALRTSGRIKLEKASGIATIFAGNTVQVVTPGLDMTATSFILLTPRADLGTRRLWYTSDTSNDRFTIRVSSAVSTDLRVGWLLIG